MSGALADRFWNKVDRSGECWEWRAVRTPEGYGKFAVTKRQIRMAHRVAYELTVGAIPAGLQIDHLCRNTGCVNPDHLEPVTPRVNTLRGSGPSALNVHKVRCPEGHPYIDENTYVSRGKRRCRKCNAAAVRRYKIRRQMAAADAAEADQ